MTKFCIYQIGYGVIHAIGETAEQCKQNYLNETGEEFDGSDNYYQCANGDCVLLPCTDEVYNRVLKYGGQLFRNETLEYNYDTNVLELWSLRRTKN